MQKLTEALSLINGVVAVGLGGSRGLCIADENSDYDFVLFRNGGQQLAAKLIVDTLRQFVDPATIQVQAGFVTAQVAGKKIEIFQKDLTLVAREIAMAREGRFRWSVRPLFPHGDLSTGLISHIIYLELCSEMDGAVSNLRKLAEPLPDLLMRSLITTFMRQAAITVTHAKKIRKEGDFQHLFALCSAFAFYANLVMFAMNRMYPVIERGGAKLMLGFRLRPENYEQRISAVFQASCKGDLKHVFVELTAMLEELRSLANTVLSGLKVAEPPGKAPGG